MLDNGYPQNTLTETLKNCVHNEPVVLKEQLKAANLIASLGELVSECETRSHFSRYTLLAYIAHVHFLISSISCMLYCAAGSKTKPSSSSNLPIAIGSHRQNKQKNEIYVDILEKLTVLFNSNGLVVNSSIDGSIQMKSFLSGNPELRLALNEDLVIGTTCICIDTHTQCVLYCNELLNFSVIMSSYVIVYHLF